MATDVFPTTVAEAGQAIRDAKTVRIVGGGSWTIPEDDPQSHVRRISSLKLNRLIDYPARDMTVTVEAGMTVCQLQQILAQENQYLPIDFAGGETATVGGVLATNRSGPRRLGHGTLRDYVIGIGFLDDEGREIHGGGRVVKNVAGYDLMKLQIGAFGSLGMITQVTLKVKPKPETTVLVGFGVDDSELDGMLDRLHTSPCRPIALELMNANALRSFDWNVRKSWIIACAFEEKKTTVDWQIQTLQTEIARDHTIFRDLDACRWLHTFAEMQRDDTTVKINAVPSQVASIVRKFNVGDTMLFSHAGNGIVYARVSGTHAVDLNFSHNSRLQAIHSPIRNPNPLMVAIKKQLDPNNRFA